MLGHRVAVSEFLKYLLYSGINGLRDTLNRICSVFLLSK